MHGTLYCARVAGHLKERPHADDHKQRTDDTEDLRRHHHTVRSCLAIVNYATEHGIKGAARWFGLDRKTVRAWRRRWQAAGLAGLVPRYLPSERAAFASPPRQFAGSVSAWGIRPLSRKPQRHPRQLTLFSRERPGDCVQVDVKEVKVAGTKCFQYTAIDDCTRYRILRFYLRKNQWTSHKLFTTLQTTLPFPIRKLQVDNINEVLKLMSGPLQAKHLNVRTTLSPEADRLHSDRDQIEQVLLNVIGNAIDASPMDELALEITAHEASREEHPGLMIQIRDAGEGVATAALARVFEPIFTSGKRNGTGFGMAICKNIIERHRGDIHLTSAVGEGTIVSIWLPSTQDVQSVKG